MKKVITGAAVLIGAVAALHHYAPELHKRAMTKCHEMMTRQGGCPPMEKATKESTLAHQPTTWARPQPLSA